MTAGPPEDEGAEGAPQGGGAVTAFECCWSANDPESWELVEAYDAEQAAEKYAEEHCCEEGCGAFEGTGNDITVRDPKSGQHLALFTVTAEPTWTFSAHPKVPR